jgi:hypothetical protein
MRSPMRLCHEHGDFTMGAFRDAPKKSRRIMSISGQDIRRIERNSKELPIRGNGLRN